MPAYNIGGLRVKSQKYGDIKFLYARFNEYNTRPTGSYSSVSDLTADSPACPWEQTVISFSSNQYFTYLENWGFPTIFPYSLEDIWRNTIPGKSYYDVWEFSNGKTYYVFRGNYSNQRWIELSRDESNSDKIRFTTPVNMNILPVATILSYNKSLNPKVLQGIAFTMKYDGTTFSVDWNTYAPSSIPFEWDGVTEKEIAFYTELPNDITGDPFEQGGESGTGGGTGDFDGTGDDIDIPGLPTLSAVDAGFITLFNPTIEQLQNLSNYMWSDAFDVATFQKLFADPMDAILGLSIVPVSVPSSGAKDVSIGNISTGVSMQVAATQYIEVDCGTLNVNEFWGAYLDYDPYTKAELYLPYCGTHPLSVDDIMGKPVTVKYHVDILSGACTAFVKCGGSVLYEFIGQCSSSIPITGNDWTNVINGAISIAGSIGTMVATGGSSAPMSVRDIASTVVNTMKPSVEKSGAMGGTGGMLAVQTPYLILTRPRQALPREQNKFMGYPAFITENLGSISGYTEIESIHLENIPATEQELSEIESLLKGGVIF